MHMPVDDSLGAATLRRALIAGARRVIASRDGLNRINVFPVADGDTGNNLASTLGSVLNGALSRRSRHAGELLSRVGNDAIDGARGNSGAILAQFLHGVAEHVKSLPSLDAQSLAAAVRHGAASARLALAKPVEGTIVSVITAFAEELERSSVDNRDRGSREGFALALSRARRALADTPRQLAVLQKAGVVDAGAQGFVDLLEGIAEFVEGGPRAIRMRGANAPAANETGEARRASTNTTSIRSVAGAANACCWARRWIAIACAWRWKRSAPIPSSSPAARSGCACMRMWSNPQALFDACAALGQVEAMKADDMLRQQRSAASGLRVAIVTDSAADLPEAIAERHAIGVVPARVDLDGRDYLDKVGLSTHEFYRRMAESRQLPRTSQPPPGDFMRQFELALAHHPQVLYVGLSRAVSGTLQSGEHAAARTDSGRVQVFDTFNAAAGEALLVWRAAEMAEAGADAATILAELERLRPQTLLWAMTRDISHVVRGGRIPGLGRAAGPAHRADAGGTDARGRHPGSFRRVVRAQARARGLRPQRGPQAAGRRALAGDRRPLRCAGRGRTPARRTACTHRHQRVASGGNRRGDRRACGSRGIDRGRAARAVAMKRLPSRA